MSTDYVLGNDQEELTRLKLQHDLWKPELLKLWQKSNIKSAHKVLDLGCGPGFTSLDLLDYIQHPCELTCVDISENFLRFLQNQKEHLQPGQILTTQKSFIEDLHLSSTDFDVAFCRWLMIFVQDPEKAIQKIHFHLKPKSQFILQEYVSYDSMDLVPDFKHMHPVVEAVFKSWKDQGGDPNRGKKLPYWLEKAGFKVVLIEPVAKFARSNEPLWAWPESFFKSFLPRLEKTNYLSATQVSNFFKEWDGAKRIPGAYFVAPTVINIIAQKV